MNKKKKNEIILAVGIFLVATTLLMIGLRLSNSFGVMEDIDKAAYFLKSFGIFSPLVFVLLQALQVVIAPVPGGLVGVLGGIVFGSFFGSILGTIGITLGSVAAFFIARRFGRPALVYFAGEKQAKKLDSFFSKNGAFMLFMIYILPYFPDDLFCYAAGLSKMGFKRFLIVTIIGRGFNMFYLGYFGGELELLARHSWIVLIVGLFSLTLYLLRDKIREYGDR
jgi:uncharacterized membrane protein YdjX (TVP38/TMEM64 family)